MKNQTENELNQEYVPMSDNGNHLSFVGAISDSDDINVVLLLNRERQAWQVVEYTGENWNNPQKWHIVDEKFELKNIIKVFDDYCSLNFEIVFNGLPSFECLPS